MTTPPGWYHAQGDPEGTIRYWDGSEWSAAPTPAPTGWQDPHRPNADRRFATAGIRVGAALIDGLISLVLVVPFLFSYLGDVIDDIDAGGDGTNVPLPTNLIFVGLILSVVYLLMVAFLGGTPGKLMLGLRITTDDATTTPPGLLKAVLRAVPSLLAAIPVLSFLGILLPLAALIMVIYDGEERRSIYDRVAGTRVVRKDSLPS